MFDPDRSRPALPDPQQDRHVAFPDDSPEPSQPALPSLPAEAWARPAAGPGAWSPRAAPSILSTPPTRPAPRRKAPAWLLALLLPPLLLGIASHGSDEPLSQDCSYVDADAGPIIYDCAGFNPGTGDGLPADSVRGVWAEKVAGATPVGPLLTGSPRVEPVPAQTRSLRVELVASPGRGEGSPLQATVDTTAGLAPLDFYEGTLPYSFELHVDSHPSNLSVSAALMRGAGTLQCRVYAGDKLVAIDTSSSTVTCTPAM